jgi:acetyl/propionyl-CoA carboxylase alpha subunit
MDEATRATLCATAVRAARAVDCRGAGTIEFIADASAGLRPEAIWFMEMNTRLQVEHPVTEAITGVDLVAWQIRVACGEPLPLRQDEIAISGHAIEARLYAEDPARNFLPSTGRLARFRLPGGLRVDSGFDEGDVVTPHYDPMLAKLIAHGTGRADAAQRLAHACAGVQAWPVKTNANFLTRCLIDRGFLAGDIDTGFIASRGQALLAKARPSPAAAAALANRCEDGPSPRSPGFGPPGFRLNAPAARRRAIMVDGEELELELDFSGASPPHMTAGHQLIVFEAGAAFALSLPGDTPGQSAVVSGDGTVRAPMPGKVISILVENGQAVKAGQSLVVLEAMKMEHALAAPRDGEIAEIAAKVGDQVIEGALLARLSAPG